MHTFAIFGNNYQQAHIAGLHKFFEFIGDHTLYIESRFARYLASIDIHGSNITPVSEIPDDAEMVISIGGDGTFLRSASWARSRDIPILGINTGHLGYLAAYSFNDFQSVSEALTGNFAISPRMTLRIECDRMPGDINPVVLNEISISKGDTTSMVHINAWIDDNFLCEYLADGLVVATPTGSTAYSLSCGGPIVDPNSRNIILTPIAPHSLTMRPLVVGPHSVIKLQLWSRGEICHIGLDGCSFPVSSQGTELTIRCGEYPIQVAQPQSTDFPSILRDKLRWSLR